MGDKSPPKPIHSYLKRSTNKVGQKINTNTPSPKSPKSIMPKPTNSNSMTSINNKNTPDITPSNINNINHSKDINTQKTFAETTANISFPKKNQAIIFNTIDGIPQIEYIKAISLITNPLNIKFASRISNNRFSVYFSNSNIVNDIVTNNPTINVNDHVITIRRLENQAKRIIISNVSPIIPHSYITEALNQMGIDTLTPISFLKAGFSAENLSHIISFRRQTYIKFEDSTKLPGSLLIRFEDTEYRIFLTDDIVTCYHCKRTGHTSAHCKNSSEQNKPFHINQEATISSQIETISDIEPNIKNDETLSSDINLNMESESNLLLEALSLPSQDNTTIDSLAITSQATDSFLEKYPPINPSTILNKRPLSGSSSQKSPTTTVFPIPSPLSETTEIWKKPKIRSRSNSSSRSEEIREEALKHIEVYFSNHQSSTVNYLQFKFILEQSTNKKINIHSLCEQVNSDSKSIMDLIDEMRPHINNKSMKTRLTKLSQLLFQTLPSQDTPSASLHQN